MSVSAPTDWLLLSMTVAPMTGSPRESVTFPLTVTFWAKTFVAEATSIIVRKRQRMVLNSFINLLEKMIDFASFYKIT
jgi:hypothetical protein